MGKHIRYEENEHGEMIPVPVYTPPITKDSYEVEMYRALARQYEPKTDKDGNYLPGEEKYKGWTNAAVIQDRKVQNAAKGELDFMKAIDDRVLGKPVQPTVNTNLTMTAHEYLQQLPTPDDSRHTLLEGFMKNPCPGIIIDAELTEGDEQPKSLEINYAENI